MLQYTLRDFETIQNNGFECILDDAVHKTINDIAREVSNPDYNKTPQFNKKKRNHIKQFDGNLPEFKITKKKEKSGIEKSIDSIRKNLNKLSLKTYDKLSELIMSEISEIIENNDENIKNDINKVGSEIFKIASSGIFYSEMYAQLYEKLMLNYPIMTVIFMENLETFRKVFYKIEYCDPNEDYNKFCENNKANQSRRALALFFLNLMKRGALEKLLWKLQMTYNNIYYLLSKRKICRIL